MAMSNVAGLGPLMQLLQQIMGGGMGQGAAGGQGMAGGSGGGMSAFMQLLQLLAGGGQGQGLAHMVGNPGQTGLGNPGPGLGLGGLSSGFGGGPGNAELKTGPGQTPLGPALGGQGSGVGPAQTLFSGGLSSILGAAPETLGGQYSSPVTPGGVIPTVNGPNNPVNSWPGQMYIGG